MIAARPFSEERVNFINENDARLSLSGKGEQSGNELVRFSVPLIRQDRGRDIDERGARLFRKSLG